MILLDNPIPVTLEHGAEKIPGFLMQVTKVGIMVELAKIPFKAGTFVTAEIRLTDGTIITERVRSIKHYDKFIRHSNQKPAEGSGSSAPQPHMLCELHFQKLSEVSRVALSKFILQAKSEK